MKELGLLMEDYAIIEFPVGKAFDEMTPKEGRITFEWFIGIIPERMAILENEIHQDYPTWRADYTRESLFNLGKWVKSHVKMRKFEEHEKENMIRERGMTKFQADLIREMDEKLSPGSERIRFDAGIYLGETLKKNIEHLEWQYEKRKRMASKGSPILALKKNSPIKYHPMIVLQISRTTTIGLAEGDTKDDQFVYIYDRWYKNFTKGPRTLPPDLLP
ncbi:hypothetical protein [Fulvivirga lutea]|uniref:Uncharacterized protein n=1 Tax=Fulvivirga lutea TaxID=2810512 RepID=A0A975A339_9BACT|nr:hypothetical protein [Fulvivirga lutea]QSE99207.1 hypothetical protein JR347_08995 [Fulvivirga lutea]